MKHQRFLVIVMVSVLLAFPVVGSAGNAAMAQEISASDLKPDLPQPYVVKKGDTLWDIASYFFKDPHKWMKIWERNLYISNPDLIYPGNEIWFDVKKVEKNGGITAVRPQPQIKIKPVERLEAEIDTSMILTALTRQDFIQPEDVEGVGYILDSEDDRINYGASDKLYLKFNQQVSEGDVFDIFRTGDPIIDPKSGEIVGVLVNHLGQIEVLSESGGIYRGLVSETFEELSRGDRLKPAKVVDTRIKPSYPAGQLSGQVLYIRNNAAEAGQNQVIGIDLGLDEGLQSGAVLSVHKVGRVVKDRVTGNMVTLPEEKIGEIVVLVAQKDASMALVTSSIGSINRGDIVRNKAGR